MFASLSSPPIDKIRKGLADAGLPNSSIQQISDISDPTSKNDVVIGLEQQGQGDQALDAGKQTILDVLHKTFGGDASKPDFNSMSAAALAGYLTQKDPLSLGVNAGIAITIWRSSIAGCARQKITAAWLRVSTN